MFSKTKMKCSVVAFVAIIITFLSQGTLAYYQTVGNATNVITSGNIQFIIHETTDQGMEFPKEGVYIVPGDIVSKKVNIESDCEHPFYLRVKMVYGIKWIGKVVVSTCRNAWLPVCCRSSRKQMQNASVCRVGHHKRILQHRTVK